MAAMFKALGDPTRLRIFHYLRGCCGSIAVDESGEVRPVTGPTVGEVCCRVTGAERITSTLSHHLKELRHAGIITMRRQGRSIHCALNPEAVAALTDYFAQTTTKGENDVCCEPEDEICCE